MNRKIIYAPLDAASLAIITPAKLESIKRMLPQLLSEELHQAWLDALAHFREA